MKMQTPPALKKGDKVAIVAPASAVKAEYIESAAEAIRRRGYEPVVFPHAGGRIAGNYSGTIEERSEDLTAALADPAVRAVLCARGGYGTVHLLPDLKPKLITADPKWIVGFSDISALHALALSCGVKSLHGPMAKDLDSECGNLVFAAMESGAQPRYKIERGDDAMPANRDGVGRGMLLGGNMAVLGALCGTPLDIYAMAQEQDTILFIEDIAEPVYKVERMLYQIYLAGGFNTVTGLIVGRFTEYEHAEGEHPMERMIADFLERHDLTDFPVVYGFPLGHIADNHPLMEGERITLIVEGGKTTLYHIADQD